MEQLGLYAFRSVGEGTARYRCCFPTQRSDCNLSFRLWLPHWLTLVIDIPFDCEQMLAFLTLLSIFVCLGTLWPAVLHRFLTWECSSGS